MFRSPLIALVPVLVGGWLAAGSAAADVYKYTDEKGNTQYTDKPATLPAERLHVQSQKTDVVEAQSRAAADMQRMQNADRTRQKGASSKAEEQETNQLTAKDKAERCTKARERYDTYMNSQRLYEQQANGERRYLTDEELDAARASAKATMDVMCK